LIESLFALCNALSPATREVPAKPCRQRHSARIEGTAGDAVLGEKQPTMKAS
jgi:hypothetical protein